MASLGRVVWSAMFALILLVQPCVAQERVKPKRLWKISIVALAAANALDFASSRGRMEVNPLMRGPGGSFSWQRGVAVKCSISAATVVMQTLMLRRSPDPHAARAAAVVNFGSAAVIGGVAARNLGVPKATTP